MTGIQGLTQEHPLRGGPRLESAERQAARLLDAQLQQLVERASALVDAPQVSLTVLDPASQALIRVATCSRHFNGSPSTHLGMHEKMARWVTTHRVPALITDFASDPRARALRISAIGSLLAVPLQVGQEALGALTIFSPSINAFAQNHLRLVEMVADLSALAIFQSRQLDATAQQKKHLTILLEVSRALTRSLDARTIVGLTVPVLRRLIHCEEAVIFRYQANTETLCGLAGLGTQSPQLAEARIQLNDPQSVTAWVAQQRRPLMHTRGTQGFIGPATEALLARREMALLAVPLVASEQLWGVITLARSAPFSTGDLRTMLTLSQMIAPALLQTRDA